MQVPKGLHYLTGVSIGIGLIVLLNKIQIPFYLYYPTTTNTVLISDSFDLYFFLVSTVCVPISLWCFSRKLSWSGLLGILAIWIGGLILTVLQQFIGVPILYLTITYSCLLSVWKYEARRSAATDVLFGAFIIFLLIESATIYYWIGSALNPGARFGLMSEQLELNLTFSLLPIAIPIMLLLLFSWVWILITTHYHQPRSPAAIPHKPYSRWNMRMVAASIDLLMILAILVFFYNYLAGQKWIVGVDSYINYLNPLESSRSLTVSQVFKDSIRNFHGVYLGLLYLLTLGPVSSFSVVKFAPLILAFFTAATVFSAILRAGWTFELAILSAICTMFWLPTTLGIYAGIQANWVAYFLWMFFLSIYLQSGESNAIRFVLQGLISVAILLIHPWTWGVFLTSLVLTAIISLQSTWKRPSLQGLFAALIFALPAGVAAYELSGFRNDMMSALNLYFLSLSNLTHLMSFGGALSALFHDWTPFLSPVILLICLVGAYSLPEHGGIIRNYLLAWLMTWCVGSILIAPIGYTPATPATSETQLWRILYLSPLPILLAVGIEKLLTCSRPLALSGVREQGLRRLIIALFALLIPLSIGLFLSSNPLVRLLLVLGAIIWILYLVTRFPRHQIALVLTASILLLLLINSAYRSMYPLLLDPHSLYGSWSVF